jgi:hypothetical protein
MLFLVDSCPKFEAKICPKTFRPKTSFVRSVPASKLPADADVLIEKYIFAEKQQVYAMY